MDNFMKFWGKYGWYFPFGTSILSFLIGDVWVGITNLMLAIPLFIESKSKNN